MIDWYYENGEISHTHHSLIDIRRIKIALSSALFPV
jgi:hypothetical protein